MTGQLNRVDVTVLPAGWLDRQPGPLPADMPVSAEASGSWSGTLSPDGRHAAYVSDRSGCPKVWVQPVGSELTFMVDTGEHPVASVHWSTGGGWLACVLAPGGAPRTEVWLVRPDGSALHQVAGFGADSAENVRWLPGRPLLAVTENLRTTLLVDAEHGTREVITTGELVTLFDVSPDRGRALLRHGPRGGRHIVVRDLATGAEEYVTSGEQACFGPDGAVYARSDAGEFPVLIRVPAASPAEAPAASPTAEAPTASPTASPTAEALAASPAASPVAEVLAASPTAEVESFALSPDGSSIAVLWNVRGGESELTLLTDGEPATVGLPGPVVSGVSWCFDGSTLVFTAEGPGQPHGVWTYDGELHPVAVEERTPDAVRPVLHRFASHDGLEISGWLSQPATPGPHPTVLWLHGGPEAQERPGYSPLFQSLVNRGIAVFAPNVRGSSGFGRSFVNADNGALRYAAIADVAACVTYLVSTGVADPARVGCMGRSYGGYLTLAALTTYPSMFATGIDVCGMSNFATFYEHTEPWIAAAAISKYGDPVTDAELLRDLSPLTRIDNLTAPLMIVHGENDSNVPVIEAEQVVAALAARGVPYRYLLFPDEGHELQHRASRAEYLRQTVDWLTTHLAPAPALLT